MRTLARIDTNWVVLSKPFQLISRNLKSRYMTFGLHREHVQPAHADWNAFRNTRIGDGNPRAWEETRTARSRTDVRKRQWIVRRLYGRTLVVLVVCPFGYRFLPCPGCRYNGTPELQCVQDWWATGNYDHIDRTSKSVCLRPGAAGMGRVVALSGFEDFNYYHLTSWGAIFAYPVCNPMGDERLWYAGRRSGSECSSDIGRAFTKWPGPIVWKNSRR